MNARKKNLNRAYSARKRGKNGDCLRGEKGKGHDSHHRTKERKRLTECKGHHLYRMLKKGGKKERQSRCPMEKGEGKKDGS